MFLSNKREGPALPRPAVRGAVITPWLGSAGVMSLADGRPRCGTTLSCPLSLPSGGQPLERRDWGHGIALVGSLRSVLLPRGRPVVMVLQSVGTVCQVCAK